MNDGQASEDFNGSQTIAHFFKSVMARMADEGAAAVEMEMDIAGKTVSFTIEVTDVQPTGSAA